MLILLVEVCAAITALTPFIHSSGRSVKFMLIRAVTNSSVDSVGASIDGVTDGFTPISPSPLIFYLSCDCLTPHRSAVAVCGSASGSARWMSRAFDTCTVRYDV